MKCINKIMKTTKKTLKSCVSLLKIKRIVPILKVTDENKMLTGKVALITGGSGGIGLAIAKSFLESGCKVIICGTNNDKLKKCCQELGDNSAYMQFNLNDVKTFNEKVEQASNVFGHIDILVNSAGMHISRKNLDFLNIKESEYDDIMNLNLKGTYFFCQSVSQYMIKNKIKGHILFISSQSALEPSWSPYRLSKNGINSVIKGLAQKLLPYEIIVNGIGPGPTATSMQQYVEGGSIYTDQNPIERYTMPEEVASYAKLLVSDLGNTIIGDTIYMSGGSGIIDIK